MSAEAAAAAALAIITATGRDQPRPVVPPQPQIPEVEKTYRTYWSVLNSVKDQNKAVVVFINCQPTPVDGAIVCVSDGRGFDVSGPTILVGIPFKSGNVWERARYDFSPTQIEEVRRILISPPVPTPVQMNVAPLPQYTAPRANC